MFVARGTVGGISVRHFCQESLSAQNKNYIIIVGTYTQY